MHAKVKQYAQNSPSLEQAPRRFSLSDSALSNFEVLALHYPLTFLLSMKLVNFGGWKSKQLHNIMWFNILLL